MKYTHEQQSVAIHNACIKAKLDGHVTTLDFKKDLVTSADKILWWTFRKHMPCKKSYMFCETLDMTFCFTKEGKAIYSYAGYVDDFESERIINAFKKANKLIEFMEEEIHKFDEEMKGE